MLLIPLSLKQRLRAVHSILLGMRSYFVVRLLLIWCVVWSGRLCGAISECLSVVSVCLRYRSYEVVTDVSNLLLLISSPPEGRQCLYLQLLSVHVVPCLMDWQSTWLSCVYLQVSPLWQLPVLKSLHASFVGVVLVFPVLMLSLIMSFLSWVHLQASPCAHVPLSAWLTHRGCLSTGGIGCLTPSIM